MDLTIVTAFDALPWITEHADHLEDLSLLVARGITDTEQIERCLADAWLLNVWPDGVPITADNIAVAGALGLRVLTDDPENVAEWLALAPAMDEATLNDTPALIGALLGHGRGPAFARRLLEVAKTHGLDVTYVDLSRDIGDIIALTEAGLDEYALRLYAEVGIGQGEAIDLSAKGITPAAVRIAKAHALPRHRWAEIGTIPDQWLPLVDPTREVKGSRGFTVDDLLAFVGAGWARISKTTGGPTVLHPGEWKNDLATTYLSQWVRLTPVQAHRLVEAGMTPNDLARFHVESLRGSGRASSAAPLLNRNDPTYAQPIERVDGVDVTGDAWLAQVIDLWGLKVKPSDLYEYRMGGARNYADVRRLREAGLTPARIKALRLVHGKAEPWDPPTRRAMRSIEATLKVHASTP